MNSILWSLVPTSALPLLIMGAGLALILGLVKPRVALGFVGCVVMWILLAPLIDGLFSLLPWWLLVLLGIGFVIAVIRAVLELMIGERGTGHMLGTLGADVVRGFFRLLILPFRLLGRRER